MKSIAEEGQRRWTRSRTPQPCVKCEAQSSLAPASMCSTSCPNAPGSAIFLLKRPHPAKKKSEVRESAACRSKTHRLLVTYRCKPEFRPPYSSIHSTSPSPLLALRSLGPSPYSATTVAGHVFFYFLPRRYGSRASNTSHDHVFASRPPHEGCAHPRLCLAQSRGQEVRHHQCRLGAGGQPGPRGVFLFYPGVQVLGWRQWGAADRLQWRRMVLTEVAVDSPTLSHFKFRSATRASRPTSSTPPATRWR